MTLRPNKIAIFAILATALLIPSSTIMIKAQTSESIETDVQSYDAVKVRAKIVEIEEELKVKYNESKLRGSASDLKKVEDDIKRFNIMKQLVSLKEKQLAEKNAEKLAIIDAKAMKLISELEATIPEENKQVATPTNISSTTLDAIPNWLSNLIPLAEAAHGDHLSGWFTSATRNPDCYNPNTQFGKNSGKMLITASGGATVFEWKVSYPSKVGVGVVGNCSVKNGVNSEASINGAGPGWAGYCYLTTNLMSGTITQSLNCSGIRQNGLATVVTQAYYSGGTTFSSAPWTVIAV